MRCTRRTCAVGLVVCFFLTGNSVGGGFTSGRVSPCGSSNANETWPWCNFSAPISQRVAALVDALLPAEKAGLLRNVASAVPRLGLPTYDWWNEAVHGFARVQVINQTDGSTHDVHVNATSFPMSIGFVTFFPFPAASLQVEPSSCHGLLDQDSCSFVLYPIDSASPKHCQSRDNNTLIDLVLVMSRFVAAWQPPSTARCGVRSVA